VPASTVSVELPPVVTDVGFRLAEAPNGTPVTLSEMDSAAPVSTVVEMLLVPLPPARSVGRDGEVVRRRRRLDREHHGGSVRRARRSPGHVMVYVPAAAVPALTVRVELPPVVTEVGLTLAEAPAGVPLTVR